MIGVGKSGEHDQEMLSPNRMSHSPLHLPTLCISSRARGSKLGLTTENMFKFLRIIKALFQDKGIIFVQQVCAELSWSLDKTTIPQLNLLLQWAGSASFMTDHSEHISANSLDCLHSLRFVLSQMDGTSMPTNSLLEAAVIC